MKQKKKTYFLESVNGTVVKAVFTETQYYLNKNPEIQTIFIEFGFEIRTKTEKFDPAIEPLIVNLLASEINWRMEAVVIFYDNIDQKAPVRQRLFQLWFHKRFQKTIDKFDFNIVLDNTKTITLSIFFGCENPEREVLLPVLQEIAAVYDKA